MVLGPASLHYLFDACCGVCVGGVSAQSTEEDILLVDHQAEVVGALLDLRADRPDSGVKPAGGHFGAEEVAGSGSRGGGPFSWESVR